MEIKVEIKRIKELIQAFEKAPGEVRREMRLALNVALRDVQSRARKEHRFKSRSGHLERDIDSEVISEWPLHGRVWLKGEITRINTGRWKGHSYGEFVHGGTRPHLIMPVKRLWLRWARNRGNGAEFVFAKKVKHPGTKPDPFIYQAAENERASINATFERYTLRALQKAGIT